MKAPLSVMLQQGVGQGLTGGGIDKFNPFNIQDGRILFIGRKMQTYFSISIN